MPTAVGGEEVGGGGRNETLDGTRRQGRVRGRKGAGLPVMEVRGREEVAAVRRWRE